MGTTTKTTITKTTTGQRAASVDQEAKVGPRSWRGPAVNNDNEDNDKKDNDNKDNNNENTKTSKRWASKEELGCEQRRQRPESIGQKAKDGSRTKEGPGFEQPTFMSPC